MDDSGELEDSVVTSAIGGDQEAMAALFDRHRFRLRRMVEIRLDFRLNGRLDPSDVLQEAFMDMTRELPNYALKRNIPFFLWMRLVTGQRLMRLHRQHLGAEMRDASREVYFNQGAMPQATSFSIAEHLVANNTSVSKVAIRAELQQKLQTVLGKMEPLDQEIITLRSFEELSNQETAEVLGIPPNTATKRYVRALKRLQLVMGHGSEPC